MIIDPVSGNLAVQQKPKLDALDGSFGIGASRNTSQAAGAPDFAEMIGEAVVGLAQQLQKAERVSMAGVKGAASTQDVVEQIMAAEQSLQTSIAVRDKIVAAYLEISRMQI